VVCFVGVFFSIFILSLISLFLFVHDLKLLIFLTFSSRAFGVFPCANSIASDGEIISLCFCF